MIRKFTDKDDDVFYVTKKSKVVSDDSDIECISNHSFYDGDDEYQEQVTRYYAQMFEAEQSITLIVILDTDEVSGTTSIISTGSGIDIACSNLTSTLELETFEDAGGNNGPGHKYNETCRRLVREQQSCFTMNIRSVDCPSAPTANAYTNVLTHMETTRAPVLVTYAIPCLVNLQLKAQRRNVCHDIPKFLSEYTSLRSSIVPKNMRLESISEACKEMTPSRTKWKLLEKFK
ncbi:hypothetical protein QAD02_007218 [Eretmocerus hayati]|uniref:Uncharacterized protein n=1 Tax=Eretmocerus hayati TaxID=131215 RepID=A0ACC2N3D4_9HYME|nr:hypothetical protein QAD02_007218 [Eretmocerus hayati]